MNGILFSAVQARGLARYDPEGPGVGIRHAAAYPGERTGESVEAGELVAFTETATVQHDHSDGNSYAITFYRLADGRGWVHDFKSNKPGKPAFTVMVNDSTNRLIFVFLTISYISTIALLIKRYVWLFCDFMKTIRLSIIVF